MPRQARLDWSDTIYHVFTRGNNKQTIFKDDIDRQKFLGFIMEVQRKFPFDLYAYCLMANHYHLQLNVRSSSLRKIMHHLNNAYARYFNFRHDQVGHLFQNRYHSIPVLSDRYVLVLNRYIHLNPVHAGIVSRPEEFAWSSYRVYTGVKKTSFVLTDPVLEYFGRSAEIQREKFQRHTEDGIRKPPEFDEQVLLKSRILE